MAVEVPFLLWLGIALLLAGLIVVFLGHRPKRSLRPPGTSSSDAADDEPPSPDRDRR
jgi:hypothetical protein